MTKKYSGEAQRKIGNVMREFKEGTLTSGRSDRKVRSRKQAIAIGMSEARQSGAKVPAAANHVIRHQLLDLDLIFQRLFV